MKFAVELFVVKLKFAVGATFDAVTVTNLADGVGRAAVVGHREHDRVAARRVGVAGILLRGSAAVAVLGPRRDGAVASWTMSTKLAVRLLVVKLKFAVGATLLRWSVFPRAAGGSADQGSVVGHGWSR